MIILAIDTSCDETSAAVTSETSILSNIISSQVDEHAEFGGVVPFLAQRLHKERIDEVISLALREANVDWSQVDAVAVTYGPGLAPALQVGVEKAQELATTHAKPLYAVNHMAGHIASCFTTSLPDVPFLALLLSGGHSEIVLVKTFTDFTILGQTLDDAVGEAYDKVAKMLGLAYPGGRLVAARADIGNPHSYDLPIPMKQSGDMNFSYSGLKNAVRLLVQKLELTDKVQNDVAASFQYAAQESVLLKVKKALAAYPEVGQLAFGGGVAANGVLRQKLQQICSEHQVSLCVPESMSLCTDNGAMIGLAAWYGIQDGLVPVNGHVDRVPYASLEDEPVSW